MRRIITSNLAKNPDGYCGLNGTGFRVRSGQACARVEWLVGYRLTWRCPQIEGGGAMGLDAQVIATGPFSKDVVAGLEYRQITTLKCRTARRS
jgi:hypothetical protein